MGRTDEVKSAVSDDLFDGLALVGPAERIAERIAAWRDSRVTGLVLRMSDPEVLTVVVEASQA